MNSRQISWFFTEIFGRKNSLQIASNKSVSHCSQRSNLKISKYVNSIFRLMKKFWFPSEYIWSVELWPHHSVTITFWSRITNTNINPWDFQFHSRSSPSSKWDPSTKYPCFHFCHTMHVCTLLHLNSAQYPYLLKN